MISNSTGHSRSSWTAFSFSTSQNIMAKSLLQLSGIGARLEYIQIDWLIALYVWHYNACTTYSNSISSTTACTYIKSFKTCFKRYCSTNYLSPVILAIIRANKSRVIHCLKFPLEFDRWPRLGHSRSVHDQHSRRGRINRTIRSNDIPFLYYVISYQDAISYIVTTIYDFLLSFCVCWALCKCLHKFRHNFLLYLRGYGVFKLRFSVTSLQGSQIEYQDRTLWSLIYCPYSHWTYQVNILSYISYKVARFQERRLSRARGRARLLRPI